MKRVNVTGIEEAKTLLEVSTWLREKEKQLLAVINKQAQPPKAAEKKTKQ